MNAVPSLPTPSAALPRRSFIKLTGAGATAALLGQGLHLGAADLPLPPLQDVRTEGPEPAPPPSDPPTERIGFAIVGLGHIALEQVLPAFAHCKHARPVALVSGNPGKARKIASQYGIAETALYNYANFDQIAENSLVQATYIALPNGLHAEFTVRSARAGKHVLCEKPMANSVVECEQMMDACRHAKVRLMIGYRSQYEPFDQALVQLVQEGKLGELREFLSCNSIQQGDPGQWRLNRALAGGGPLPDVGIYSLNAARFISGEEPEEVVARVMQLKDDPRFREVESSAQFVLRFPSGFTATCSSSYASHRSQFLRVNGVEGWAELDPAFAYNGLRLRVSRLQDGKNVISEPAITAKNHFTEEIDHFAECIAGGLQPHTPGEEGWQDMRIIAAIYESARTGTAVKIAPLKHGTRGPAPKSVANG
jgi:predicted dehydrogenase